MTKNIGGYTRLPGTARNYVDTSTGEVISRAERDRRTGALFDSGFRSYGERKQSIEVQRNYTNKNNENGMVYGVQGVTNKDKAIEYLTKHIGASDTAFYSFRVKLKDGSWRSVKTSSAGSAAQNFGVLLQKYEIDLGDIEDIELVVLD